MPASTTPAPTGTSGSRSGSTHRETLRTHLAQFAAVRDALAHGGRWAYEHSAHHDGGEHDNHVVFGVMVHGDEVGSLPGVLAVLQDLAAGRSRFGGRVTVFVGNPEAGLANVRFLERDLNRVFLDLDEDSHEVRRGREIRPLLDEADLFVDFHQTILPTEQPFWICPWTVAASAWARATAGAEVWITRAPTESFSKGTCCADEYVRLRGKPALTLELGHKGFDVAAAARAERVMRKVLALVDAEVEQPGALWKEGESQKAPTPLQTVHRERFVGADLALAPGWTNFAPVEAGQVLSRAGAPVLLAPMSGHVVFPKYPPTDTEGAYVGPLPGEIYRIVGALDGDPAEMWSDMPEAGPPLHTGLRHR